MLGVLQKVSNRTADLHNRGGTASGHRPCLASGVYVLQLSITLAEHMKDTAG